MTKARQTTETLAWVVKYDAEALGVAWDCLAFSDNDDKFFYLFIFPWKKGEMRAFLGPTVFFRSLAHAGGCAKKIKEKGFQ